MKIANPLMLLLLGILLLVFLIPTNLVLAQPEEEEEPIQAMPNPLEKSSKMKAQNILPNTRNHNKQGNVKLKSNGTAIGPGFGQGGKTALGQGGKINGGASYDGVDGESRGIPMQLKKGSSMGK